jgi:ribonuclease BN (tRNA processing enzyme)
LANLNSHFKELWLRLNPDRRGEEMKALFALLAVCLAMPALAQPAPTVRFVTLGTGGGPVVRVERAEPANAIVSGDAVYLFDTGDGVQRQLAAARLQLRNVRAVFLTHHHVDHVGGLGPLLTTRWVLGGGPPLPVYGPPGTAEMLQALAAAARPVGAAPLTAGPPPSPFAASVAAHDLAARLDVPTLIYADANVRILAISVDHFHLPGAAPSSYAYRIEAGGRSYVYTGDTGPSPGLERLAAGADVLVSEVIDLAAVERSLRTMPGVPPAMVPALMAHMREDHLTPEAIGTLAARARVGRVVLTHLVPGLDGERDLTGYTSGIAPAFAGPVSVARDLEAW